METLSKVVLRYTMPLLLKTFEDSAADTADCETSNAEAATDAIMLRES